MSPFIQLRVPRGCCTPPTMGANTAHIDRKLSALIVAPPGHVSVSRETVVVLHARIADARTDMEASRVFPRASLTFLTTLLR